MEWKWWFLCLFFSSFIRRKKIFHQFICTMNTKTNLKPELSTHITAILMSSVGKLFWAIVMENFVVTWEMLCCVTHWSLLEKIYEFPITDSSILVVTWWLFTSISQPFWRVQWWALRTVSSDFFVYIVESRETATLPSILGSQSSCEMFIHFHFISQPALKSLMLRNYRQRLCRDYQRKV